jgi:hypothetical protein
MKRTLIILALISLTCAGYSQQVNRYSKPVQVAKFTPIDAETLIRISQQNAPLKSENIHDSAINLYKKSDRYIKETNDYLFIGELSEVKSYLIPLLDEDSRTSLSSAQWYLKKAKKKFNKAIKQYNKRLNLSKQP